MISFQRVLGCAPYDTLISNLLSLCKCKVKHLIFGLR